MTQLRQPLEKNEIVINNVRIHMPSNVKGSVAEYAMEFLVLHVACYYGIVVLGEGRTEAKRFLIVSFTNTPIEQNGKETVKIDVMTILKEGKG